MISEWHALLTILVYCFEELKRFDEAEHNYTRALSIYRCTYKDDHMDIADVLNNLGDICRLQCKYDDAEDYLHTKH